jgi:uncharacterized protein (DUF1810 family)
MPDLARFHAAQATVHATALAELRAGRKRTHWMWFMFPQIAGLGHSEMSRRYAIADPAEARAYLADPVLGARLRDGIAAVLAHRGRSARDIFGQPDDLKFRSCLTLFAAAAPAEPLFAAALAAFFPEGPDPATLALLRRVAEPDAPD